MAATVLAGRAGALLAGALAGAAAVRAGAAEAAVLAGRDATEAGTAGLCAGALAAGAGDTESAGAR